MDKIIDTTNPDTSIIQEALKSESFNQLIDDAAPIKVRIATDLAKDAREVFNQFADVAAKGNPKIAAIVAKKKKSHEEKEVYKEWKKSLKHRFQTTKKMACPAGESDPIGALAVKIIQIAQYLKYIGNDTFEDRLSEAGITLNMKTLEETDPYFADADVKTTVTDIFNQAFDIQGKVNKANEEISKSIYNQIDENLRYSKENPAGVKAAQFKKLVRTKAVALIVDDEKFTKFKEKLLAKDEADLISQKVVLEKNKQI